MMPPHRSIALPGLHAYADALSVAAGQTLGFHVSSTVPYRLSLCRLGPEIDQPTSDTVLATVAQPHPAVQAICPGSYVQVTPALAAQAPLPGFSVECWVRPWGFGARQTLVSQFDWPTRCGFGLFIDEQGCLVSYFGDGTQHDPKHVLQGPALPAQQWTHVVATLEAGTASLWVNAERVATGPAPHAMRPGTAALRLGASAVDGHTDQFLEGDLAMPVLYSHGLDAKAVRARFESQGLEPARGPTVLACWPLDEERGAQIHDTSAHARQGQLFNHGTWMIPGPAFDASRVSRYSPQRQPYAPSEDPQRGHALRLASDDLVDCRWGPNHAFKLADDAPSGLYVGRFEFELDGMPMSYDVTFVVRRPCHRPPAPMVVLCSTNTWLAYSASPFARNTAGPAHWPRRSTGLPNSHPLAPRQCTYTFHRMGQPTYHVGLRMPRPNAAPSAYYAPEDSAFSQWTRLERHLHVWLDRHGYAYDLVTDLDLHRDPGLLGAYKTVVINGHSEYWSTPAFEGLDRYLQHGGTAVVLSGNSLYWRVSFNEDGSVMEQRKTHTPHDAHAGADSDTLAPAGPHGEQYHSQDGQRGGLWRFNDRSCAEVIGLETAGWGFAEARDFGVYRVRQAEHFLFHAPLPTGLHAGSTFGHGPGGALPRAVGHEWDLTTATLLRMTHHVPQDARLPTPQRNIQVIAEGLREVPGQLDAYLDYFEVPVASLDGLSCEMIFWERPQGGRVFNAGAVGASWVLGVDEAMGRLLANVLAAFGIAYPPAGPYLAAPNADTPAEAPGPTAPTPHPA